MPHKPSQPTVWRVNPAHTDLEPHQDIISERQTDTKQWTTRKDDTGSGDTASVNVDAQGTTFQLSHLGSGLESETNLSHEKEGAYISPAA
jgi:hypothetical protein